MSRTLVRGARRLGGLARVMKPILLPLVATCFSLGLSFAVGCGDDFDESTSSRPRGPGVDASPSADGAADTAGDICPMAAPKIGEICRVVGSVDETCTYSLGTCTINGEVYDRKQEFRCHMGTWHRWDDMTGPCENQP